MSDVSPTSNGAPGASMPAPPDAGQSAFDVSIGFFLDPIRELLQDETVSEIMINGRDRVFVERAGRVEPTDFSFPTDESLRAAANNIAQFVGGTVDEQRPILDGRLPTGSRVCIVLPPIAADGISINIRKFSSAARHGSFLIERGAITEEAMAFLEAAVAGHVNILVSGGTGSGKTTLLNILCNAVSDAERIVIIEDTRELDLDNLHVVQMEARRPDHNGRYGVSIRDLFRTSLRMRPDRILVGEVRGAEALDLLQAMTSGHRGALATLHANSPVDAAGRLETMTLMADLGLPLHAVRRQVASAIDLVVQTTRLTSGRRMITHISELGYSDRDDAYLPRDLFAVSVGDAEPRLEWTGERCSLTEHLVLHGGIDPASSPAARVFGYGQDGACAP